MITPYIYALVAAVTVRNVGLLPDLSFRSRLMAVSMFLTMGFTMTFLTSAGVRAFLRGLPVPAGMVAGKWAMLGLYLAFGSELFMLMLMVVASYIVRRKLNHWRSS